VRGRAPSGLVIFPFEDPGALPRAFELRPFGAFDRPRLPPRAAYFAFSDYGSYTLTNNGEPARLEAFGVAPEISANAIRVSLGWNTTADDIHHFIAVWRKLNQRSKAKAA